MHAAAVLVDDDDLVHEIFMAAVTNVRQRRRVFEWVTSGADGGDLLIARRHGF